MVLPSQNESQLTSSSSFQDSVHTDSASSVASQGRRVVHARRRIKIAKKTSHELVTTKETAVEAPQIETGSMAEVPPSEPVKMPVRKPTKSQKKQPKQGGKEKTASALNTESPKSDLHQASNPTQALLNSIADTNASSAAKESKLTTQPMEQNPEAEVGRVSPKEKGAHTKSPQSKGRSGKDRNSSTPDAASNPLSDTTGSKPDPPSERSVKRSKPSEGKDKSNDKVSPKSNAQSLERSSSMPTGGKGRVSPQSKTKPGAKRRGTPRESSNAHVEKSSRNADGLETRTPKGNNLHKKSVSGKKKTPRHAKRSAALSPRSEGTESIQVNDKEDSVELSLCEEELKNTIADAAKLTANAAVDVLNLCGNGQLSFDDSTVKGGQISPKSMKSNSQNFQQDMDMSSLPSGSADSQETTDVAGILSLFKAICIGPCVGSELEIGGQRSAEMRQGQGSEDVDDVAKVVRVPAVVKEPASTRASTTHQMTLPVASTPMKATVTEDVSLSVSQSYESTNDSKLRQAMSSDSEARELFGLLAFLSSDSSVGQPNPESRIHNAMTKLSGQWFVDGETETPVSSHGSLKKPQSFDVKKSKSTELRELDSFVLQTPMFDVEKEDGVDNASTAKTEESFEYDAETDYAMDDNAFGVVAFKLLNLLPQMKKQIQSYRKEDDNEELLTVLQPDIRSKFIKAVRVRGAFNPECPRNLVETLVHNCQVNGFGEDNLSNPILAYHYASRHSESDSPKPKETKVMGKEAKDTCDPKHEQNVAPMKSPVIASKYLAGNNSAKAAEAARGDKAEMSSRNVEESKSRAKSQSVMNNEEDAEASVNSKRKKGRVSKAAPARLSLKVEIAPSKSEDSQSLHLSSCSSPVMLSFDPSFDSLGSMVRELEKMVEEKKPSPKTVRGPVSVSAPVPAVTVPAVSIKKTGYLDEPMWSFENPVYTKSGSIPKNIGNDNKLDLGNRNTPNLSDDSSSYINLKYTASADVSLISPRAMAQ